MKWKHVQLVPRCKEWDAESENHVHPKLRREGTLCLVFEGEMLPTHKVRQTPSHPLVEPL